MAERWLTNKRASMLGVNLDRNFDGAHAEKARLEATGVMFTEDTRLVKPGESFNAGELRAA